MVASIAPLQELAAALMLGLGEPEVVIQGHASAHHFAFKPSHLRQLRQADLVVWIDRGFESGFSRIDEILPPSTQKLELLPALGIRNGDGHIWYSPTLLRQGARIILDRLVAIDPVNRAAYERNAAELEQELRDWHDEMRVFLQRQRPGIVTEHDFLSHFVREFDHDDLVSIYDRHDNQGGLRDLARVEAWLQRRPASCLLTNEESVSALAQALADKYGLGVVDVTESIPPPGLRLELLRRLARLRLALETCEPPAGNKSAEYTHN